MTAFLLCAYIALLIALSVHNTRAASAKSLITGEGTAGPLLCALSLTSTIIGGSATLGMGALAQKTGTAAFWWLGVGAIGLVLHGLVIAPLIRRLPACTLPEVLRVLVGRRAERFAGFIIAMAWIGVTAAQFAALKTLLGDMLPGTTGTVFFIVLSGAIVLHTAAGGQKGVLRTDAVQAMLLAGGFTAAACWVLSASGTDPVLAERLAAVDPVPFNERFGFADWVKLMALVGLTYVIGPDMFSRTFASRNGAVARRGALFAAAGLVFFGAAITLLAMTNLSAGNPIAGWLSPESTMPAAIRTALAFGLVAALAGSADTVLLSACAIIERDLLGADRSGRMRLLVALFGLGAVIVAATSGDIIAWLLYAYALFVPGVALPLLVVLLALALRGGADALDLDNNLAAARTFANERLWLAGAAAGGLCGLVGNFMGSGWTFAGLAASLVFAMLSVATAFKTPSAARVR